MYRSIMFQSVMTVVLALGISSSAFAYDHSYFQIKNVKVTEVPVTPSAAAKIMDQANGDCTSNRKLLISRSGDPMMLELDPIGQLQVWVDQIINIGKKIWAVVDAGKPVVNIKVDTANALPRGVQCWTDMAGWSVPQVKGYRVQYENAYGINVVDFTYHVSFIANGNVDGVGKYITNATFIPSNLSVAWGFTFNANATVPMVLNQGTKEAPMAAMQMNMQWKVDSVMSHQETTQSYFITGDNQLIKMQ